MADMQLTLRISADGGQARAEIVGLDGSVVKLGDDTEAAGGKTRSAGDDVKRFGQDAKESGSIVDSVTKKILAYGAAYKALDVIKDTIRTGADFKASISDLSAITGATGAQLQFLSSQAREMGASTIFSANEAATAFKLVASAKPDLLENSKALSEVTHQALLLAEASGSTLPDAANTLGSSLNQFQAGADQASRFINVLAAGAKYGASEINMTSEALKVVGTVASNVGLSFESTNAAIQVLSQVALKGAEAGTGLRGTLLHLEAQSNDQFKPSVVGLTQAFKNLADANLSTSEQTKLFGIENITAAQALMKHSDQIGPMTDKLTGTSVALEQARIKTDNLTGDVLQLNSAWQEQQIALETKLDPYLRALVQDLTGVIQNTDQLKGIAAELAVGLAAVGAQALIARAGITSLSGGLVMAATGAKALAKALLPLAAAEGVLKIFELFKVAGEALGASQERLAAKIRNVHVATENFKKYLVPAREELNKLGIDIKNIDPQNIEQVSKAMHALNAERQKSVELDSKAPAGTKGVPKKDDGVKHISVEVQKVISLQAAKYARLNEMAKEADANDRQRELLKLDFDLNQMAQERQRHIAHGEWNKDLESKYSQARIDRAQITAAKLASIEDREEKKHQQKVRQEHQRQLQEEQKFQNQMLGLQQSFNQMGQNISALNLRALTQQLAAFHQASIGFEKMTAAQKMSIVSGGLGALSGLMSSHNRTMFEIGKASAIANATINVAQGVTSALKWGFPMGPIFAGIIGAAGALQIAEISKAHMGSGSAASVATPNFGGTGATPVVSVDPTTGSYQSPITSSTQSEATKREHVYYLQLPADPNQGISRAQLTYISNMQAQDKRDGIVSRLVVNG